MRDAAFFKKKRASRLKLKWVESLLNDSGQKGDVGMGQICIGPVYDVPVQRSNV